VPVATELTRLTTKRAQGPRRYLVRRGLYHLALALGCSTFACASTSGSSVAEKPSELREIDKAIAERAAQGDTTSQCEIQSEIGDAARLRGLTPKGPIQCQMLARKALTDLAVSTALRDTPKEWIQGQAEWLVLLGFAPNGFDLLGAVGSLVEEQLAGFYDPQQKTLYVAVDLDPAMGRMTLIHEIVHALQDQYFDLGKRMREAKTSDALSALQMLAEGDATSAMIEMPRTGNQVPEAIEQGMGNLGAFLVEATPTEVPVPAILKRGLLAPYLDGLLLVERQRAKGGWAMVDALWHSSPDSSAALLSADPDLWSNTVKHVELPVPPAWRAGQVPLYDDVTGEQSLRVMFEEWLARKTAATAASGWRGDRLTVWSGASGSALLWRMRWASTLDASEALSALSKGYFKGKAQQASSAKASIATRCEANGNPLSLASRGQDIVLAVESLGAVPGSDACQRVAQWAQAALH